MRNKITLLYLDQSSVIEQSGLTFFCKIVVLSLMAITFTGVTLQNNLTNDFEERVTQGYGGLTPP